MLRAVTIAGAIALCLAPEPAWSQSKPEFARSARRQPGNIRIQ
jgi:hypothetical protein